MICPPFVLRWNDGLCYWVRLTKNGQCVAHQSYLGFISEEEARSDFMRWNFTAII